MSLQIVGTVKEIKETKKYPKKDGDGDLFITKMKIDDKYFTSFDKEQLKEIAVGSKVEVNYAEKENKYQGKTYINNNISLIKLWVATPALSPETQAQVDAVAKTMETTGTNATHPEFAKNVNALIKGENTITVGDKVYKVTLELIS